MEIILRKTFGCLSSIIILIAEHSVYPRFHCILHGYAAGAHVHLVFEFLPSGDIYPNFNIDVFSVSGLSSDGTTESFGLLVLVEIVVAIQFISLLLNIYGAGLGNIRKFCFDAALMYNILCIMTFTSVFAMEHYLVMLRQEAVAETNTIKRNTYIGQISFLEFYDERASNSCLIDCVPYYSILKFSKRTSSLFGQ